MKKLLFVLAFVTVDILFAQETKKIDSLTTLLQKKLNPTERLNALIMIANEYADLMPMASIDYANQAFALAEVAKKRQEIGRIYRIIGEAYHTQGIYDKSLEYYFKAEHIFEQIKDSLRLMSIYNQIGIAFKYQENYDKALQFYYKALAIGEIKQEEDLGAMRNNVAVIYYKKKEYDKAIEITQRNLQSTDTTKDRLSYGIYIGNIGEYLVKKKNFEEGIDKLQKALGIFEQLKDYYYESFMLTFIAQAYLDEKEYIKALLYAQRCFELTQKIKAKALSRDACRILKDIYQEQRDFENALRYNEYFHAYEDSLNNEKSIQKFTQLEMQYDFDKKNQLDEIAQAKKDLANEKILEQQIFYRDAFLSFSAIIACVAFFFYQSRQREYKTNRILTEKNKEILKKNEEIETQKNQLEDIAFDLKIANVSIREQNEEIKQINENLEKLVQERTQGLLEMNQSLMDYAFYNAHKLRAPLATLMGLVYIFQLEERKNERKRIAQMIEIAAKDLDVVVKQIQEIVLKDAKILNLSD